MSGFRVMYTPADGTAPRWSSELATFDLAYERAIDLERQKNVIDHIEDAGQVVLSGENYNRRRKEEQGRS
jgi:hypothetical protein